MFKKLQHYEEIEMSNKKSLKKGMLQILFANILNMMFSIGTNFLLPKFLSIDSYSQIKTYQLYITYVAILHLGYNDGMYLKFGGKNLDEIQHDELQKNISTVVVFQAIVTIGSVWVAFLLKDTALLMAAVAILPQNMIAYFKNFYQAVGEFKKYSRIMNLTTGLTFAINVFLIGIIKTDEYVIYLIAYVILSTILWAMLEYSLYRKISVREDSAVEILEKQYLIKNSVHLVDPTLCVSGDFWRQYGTPRKIKEDYILIYNLNRSKAFDRYAVELAKRTGLKLVRFCTRYDQFYRPGKSMLVPEVFDFISLIDNAKYVLTDSFHATAFSLNLHTEPICVYPKEFGGRLGSILKQTHSTQRHIENYNDFDVVNRPVDFEEVESILCRERDKANNFIESVIADIAEFNRRKEEKSNENSLPQK